MEETTKQVIISAAEHAAQKSGQPIEPEKVLQNAMETESPLEKTERLLKEIKQTHAEVSKMKNDLERLAAFNALSGKGEVIQKKEITPNDARQQIVNELSEQLLKSVPSVK